jgi:hypothetical protein
MTTKDPARLRESGAPEARALLTSTPPVPPQGLQEQVRAAVDARVSSGVYGHRPWRLVLIGSGLLLGGTALAFGVAAVRARIVSAPTVAPRPVILGPGATPPVPSDEDPAGPGAAGPPPRKRPSVARPSPTRADQPFGGPALAWPPGRFGQPVDSPPSPGNVARPVAAVSLTITRQGRRLISISLSTTSEGVHVAGRVRDAEISLDIVGARIFGKVAGENLLLLQHGDETEGTIANHGVAFALAETPTGHLMRGSVPAHTTRVELAGTKLSYYPGCDDPLEQVAPNTYEGTCGGGKTRVVLPTAWQRLPAVPRFVLLSLLLPERDPGVSDDPPALFGPPDWPK